MEFTKTYRPTNLNFHLLPSLIDKIKSSGKFSVNLNSFEVVQDFLINTRSYRASTENQKEFKDILRNLNEDIKFLKVEIKYVRDGIARKPHIFDFFYDSDRIYISLARSDAETILQLFSEIEEELSLTVVGPEIPRPEKITRRKAVFLAHSFSQPGKSYAYELIKFLDLIGFEVSTGEAFSPERISKKIRDRLKSQEVVIVIVSENEDITWLIQEATGAAFIEKPLMLLIEEGVEFKPGILGDLEYIRFPKDHISETFSSILEGFQDLGYSFV